MSKDPSIKHPQQENQVEIIYYTDPLCCWSWAFEPQWRRLRFEFDGKIKWRYRMGGLIPDWKNYHDVINSVSRPIQMGPLWMEAGLISGMPIQNTIWEQNPPSSSFPSCIAVKCAELQSAKAAEIYLRCLREAAMIKGRNISRSDILLELAEELSGKHPFFNAEQFKNDLHKKTTVNQFRKDLEKIKIYNIKRFPTLTIQRKNQAGIMITGYRTYDMLLDAVKKIAPEITPGKSISDITDYQDFWGFLTKRELDEITFRSKTVFK